MDKIWVEKEDMPPKQRITMKSIEEIIKELTPIEKVQTLILMIDTPMGRRKYPKGIILLAQSLKEDYPPHQTRINTNIQTILNIHIPI